MPVSIVIASWIRFDQPLWLTALILVAAPVILARHARRRGLPSNSVSVALRMTALAAMVLCLAQPAARWGARAKQSVLILRDVSASTRGQSHRDLTWPEDFPAERLDFAAAVGSAEDSLLDDSTNLARALDVIAARTGRIAGAVIWTDGRFTDAGWPAAADSLATAGVEVVIVPMESPPSDARLAGLTVQRRGQTVQLGVTVTATGTEKRQLKLWRQDDRDMPLLVKGLTVPAGEATTVRLTDSLPIARAALYAAVLNSGDPFPENDTALAMVLPASRRVALVGSRAADLAAALADKLWLPVEPLNADAAPAQGAGWMNYASVVLVDASGTMLDRPQRAALAEFVRGGGGLVLIGAGPHASPADRGDPLNRVAALRANPHERRPLKLTLVLDASGSMAEPMAAGPDKTPRPKFDLVIEAVLSLKHHLTAGDALRVIAFSDFARTVYDSGASRIDLAMLRDALYSVQPGGPRRPGAALAQALAGPLPVGRDSLVMLVGELSNEPFEVPALAERFKTRSTSLAIIATETLTRLEGPGAPGPRRPAETSLERLAKALEAPLIQAANLPGLAEIFTSILRDARGEAVREGSFASRTDKLAFGVSLDSFALEAYILSAVAPGGEVLLRVGDDPILARHRVGLGRSVSLAMSLEGKVAARQELSQWGDLLAAAVRWTLRPAGDDRFTAQISWRNGLLHICVEANDRGAAINQLALEAVVQPGGSQETLPAVSLRQTADGTYEAELSQLTQPSQVSLIVREARSGQVVWLGVISKGCAPEFAAIGADWTKLRRLARRSRGRIVAEGDLTGPVRQWWNRTFRLLWPYLLTVALAAMLLEWTQTLIRQKEVGRAEG